MQLQAPFVPSSRSTYRIALSRETDGRWIGEISKISGVMCYGMTKQEAIENVKKLALEVIAERAEMGHKIPKDIHFTVSA